MTTLVTALTKRRSMITMRMVRIFMVGALAIFVSDTLIGLNGSRHYVAKLVMQSLVISMFLIAARCTRKMKLHSARYLIVGGMMLTQFHYAFIETDPLRAVISGTLTMVVAHVVLSYSRYTHYISTLITLISCSGIVSYHPGALQLFVSVIYYYAMMHYMIEYLIEFYVHEVDRSVTLNSQLLHQIEQFREQQELLNKALDIIGGTFSGPD